MSSYAISPLLQYEDIITGILVISKSLTNSLVNSFVTKKAHTADSAVAISQYGLSGAGTDCSAGHQRTLYNTLPTSGAFTVIA
jgi:hypothetical protein